MLPGLINRKYPFSLDIFFPDKMKNVLIIFGKRFEYCKFFLYLLYLNERI